MPNYNFSATLTKPLLVSLENMVERHDRYEAYIINQRKDLDAKDTQYWYRSMPQDEYQMLEVKNRLFFMGNPGKLNSYGGIATNYDYVSSPRTYFGKHHSATHIVEFKTPAPGYLYQKFDNMGIIRPKAEGGGGSYGLGPAGMNAGMAGLFFNKMLATGEITWRVVAVKK